MACDTGIPFSVEQEADTLVEGSLLGTLLEPFDLGGLDDFDVGIQQELADQGIEEGDLVSLHLSQFTMSVPEGQDLSFLEEIQIFVEAPGVAAEQIASSTHFDEGATTVALDLEDVDLVAFVEAGPLTFTAEVVGTPPADDTPITLHVGVAGEATVQGACNAAKQ